MIKLEKGIANISGPSVLVEAEFCCLVRSMKEFCGEEKMKELFELAMMPTEEIDKKTKEIEEELAQCFSEKFKKHLDEVFDSFMERNLYEKKEK